jgi:diguanylate cyclase (GGDEF)-like protein
MTVAIHDILANKSWLGALRSWALWREPTRVRALVVTVSAAAVLLSASVLVHSTITAGDLLRFGLLAAMSVVYLEVSSQVEVRRRLFAPSDSSHVDMSSVWILGAALILPPGLAVLIVPIAYTHLWVRSWRSLDGVHAYRVAYTGATMAITCLAASAVAHVGPLVGHSAAGLLAAIVLAAVTYRVVNQSLVVLAIASSVGVRERSTITGTRHHNAVEFATFALGAATAVLVLRLPPLALLVLPAVFLLQHRALLKQLVEAATIDMKTDLLNAAAWRQLAERELERAARQHTATAVLVIDMDHFKRLNDTYGHLAGDEALRAIGAALGDVLRGYDAVGRFGGEEFVALLPGVDGATAVGVAERVRERIESVRVPIGQRTGGVGSIEVTASVGVAAGHGAVDLDEVLRAADDALYAAKAAGRNVVRNAPVAVSVPVHKSPNPGRVRALSLRAD